MASKKGQEKREADRGDSIRMVKVKCLLDRPYATWDDGKGPRRIKNGEIIDVPEDMLSESWMEPLENVDWSLSKKRKATAVHETRQNFARARNLDEQTETLIRGGVEDPRNPGMAAEAPAPAGVMAL